jgi:5-oxoprolinase (ATP-hydrolysing) subunit C
VSGVLEVVESGLAVTVQDRGRFGYRDIGVPVSGALDPMLLAAANALLGNPAGAAGLEVTLAGPGLKALSGTLRVALAGEMGGRVLRARGSVLPVAPWSTITLASGDSLEVGAVARGIGYVAVSGGVAVAEELGSRSTYQRAALGGVSGRALDAGDRLPCGEVQGDPWLECRSPAPLVHEEGPIRVILGPQDDHFTDAALEAFLSRPYTVSRDMDRMGMRLEGPALTHSELGADIVSDGVVPGAIQVPANGQPIVLLADCQTTGGYPKIATVIRADLLRLAHARPGTVLRFASVSQAEAAAARRALAERLSRWVAGLESFQPPGVVDDAALYGGNLISGTVRGDEPPWPGC